MEKEASTVGKREVLVFFKAFCRAIKKEGRDALVCFLHVHAWGWTEFPEEEETHLFQWVAFLAIMRVASEESRNRKPWTKRFSKFWNVKFKW
jgi:cyclopropane fatty-acyl-phospholipid synthase-like methyltransferase